MGPAEVLQLIETTDRASGENRTQQVSHISRSLKNLGRELGVPIIALSQLSRAAEQRNPPIPILSDLRDSGTIEEDADIVLMLYRQGMYDEDCENPDETDVYVRKNRNGPTGTPFSALCCTVPSPAMKRMRTATSISL